MIYRDFQDEEKEEGFLGGVFGEQLGGGLDEDEDEDGIKPGADEEEEEKEWE